MQIDLAGKLERITASTQRAPSPARSLIAGLERRTVPSDYFWDGERRGGDPKRPFVVVQYTLAGTGIYEDDTERRQIGPGDIFLAVVPSRHRYYLPATSAAWYFFYLLIRQPYAVARLTEAVDLAGPVHRLPEDSPPLARLTRLYEAVQTGVLRDEFDDEAAAVDFAIEFARFAHNSVYPQRQRERLLDQSRTLILSKLTVEISVTELAGEFGMTRTGFSHHFKSATGLSPAAFIRQVRLEQAALILTRSDAKLEAVAEQCGFASANDLCKLFRKHYHQSPTAFRRLTR